jgi:hypothetical protein
MDRKQQPGKITNILHSILRLIVIRFMVQQFRLLNTAFVSISSIPSGTSIFARTE